MTNVLIYYIFAPTIVTISDLAMYRQLQTTMKKVTPKQLLLYVLNSAHNLYDNATNEIDLYSLDVAIKLIKEVISKHSLNTPIDIEAWKDYIITGESCFLDCAIEYFETYRH